MALCYVAKCRERKRSQNADCRGGLKDSHRMVDGAAPSHPKKGGIEEILIIMGASPLKILVAKERCIEKLSSKLSTGERAEFGDELLSRLQMLTEIEEFVKENMTYENCYHGFNKMRPKNRGGKQGARDDR